MRAISLVLGLILLRNDLSYTTTIYDFLQPGQLVFDIGAHAGKMVDRYRAIGCRVIAVEPMADFANNLRVKYAKDNKVEVVQGAVSEKAGEIVLNVCSQAPTITTCSAHWMTGRFKEHNYKWDKSYKVPTYTLDQLIEMYGMPRFCKIDVEGHEVSVLKGLSHPISCLSFEFAIEFIQDALTCMNILSAVDTRYRFNIAFGEDNTLVSPTFVDAPAIMRIIRATPPDKTAWGLWGDIYAMIIE